MGKNEPLFRRRLPVGVGGGLQASPSSAAACLWAWVVVCNSPSSAAACLWAWVVVCKRLWV